MTKWRWHIYLFGFVLRKVWLQDLQNKSVDSLTYDRYHSHERVYTFLRQRFFSAKVFMVFVRCLFSTFWYNVPNSLPIRAKTKKLISCLHGIYALRRTSLIYKISLSWITNLESRMFNTCQIICNKPMRSIKIGQEKNIGIWVGMIFEGYCQSFVFRREIGH